ncbi:MAG: hypothetical protein Q6K90_04415 [Gloeomargarita sp. HHBFW_bins_162]
MTLLAERLLLLGLVGWVVLWLWQQWTWQRQQQKLETVFYDLLKQQKGKITLIQLVTESRINPEVARKFLTEKAQFFGAVIDTDARGNDYYQFPYG